MMIILSTLIFLTFIATLTLAPSSSSPSELTFPPLLSRKQQPPQENEDSIKGSIINLSIPLSISAHWPYSHQNHHQSQWSYSHRHKYYLSDDMMDDSNDDMSSITTSSWEGYGMGREYDLMNVFQKTRGGQSSPPIEEARRGGWWGRKRVQEVSPRRTTVVATVPNPSFYRHRRRLEHTNNDDSNENEDEDSLPSVASPSVHDEPPSSSKPNSMYHNIFSSLRSHLPFHHHHSHTSSSSTSTSLPTTKITLPKLRIHIEPTTTLKFRKTYHFSPPFQKNQENATFIVGANYNVQGNTWRFKGCLEDLPFLNFGGGGKGSSGKLLLIGRELQLCKTWLLSVGSMEDFVTRLRFRAAVDLKTRKAYAKFGFRTERLSPINIVEGFSICKQFPLMTSEKDEKERVKLEIKANFVFPEPELEYSTGGGHDEDEYDGSSRSGGVLGMSMGDVEINVDELNLLLDY